MRHAAALIVCIMAVLAAGIFVRADAAVPSDGDWRIGVTLSGGSGKASVESPCRLRVSEGQMTAVLKWSSPHYDYMICGGETYLPLSTEGGSVFEIPLPALDEEISVTADTTAMGTPHEIDYTLFFDSSTLAEDSREGAAAESGAEAGADAGSGESPAADGDTQEDAHAPDWESLLENAEEHSGVTIARVEENTAADCFRICRCDGGFTLLLTDDGGMYLLVPEGSDPPECGEDVVVLRQPLGGIYLAASAAMCQFADLGAVGQIAFSGLQRDAWYVDAAVSAMDEGTLVYAGKYSSPDYELLLAGGCTLAVESTMILHVPKVREKLIEIGIPVMIDRSSYERDPLARTEWIRFYGELTGRSSEAEAVFEKEKKLAYETEMSEPLGKTAAFFYLNNQHQAVVRSSEDYIAKMIGMAGYTYIGPDSEGRRSTVTMPLEEFCIMAADADYLIYNATVSGDVTTVGELTAADSVLETFRAVREGNVYCTTQSVYQKSNAAGSMIREFRAMSEDLVSGEFLRKVE